MVRIQEIQPGSVAEELQLEIGTRIVRINGQLVRDGLDFTFLSADEALDLEAVTPDGETLALDVDREPGEPLGIVPAADKIRECANECVFCFIDGNPRDVRESLWLRDDDFRLSFTYGSYVTLTNLGPRGLQRLVEQRISPLYVSVHATDPDVRVRLLKNERAGLILDQLRYLLDNGLELHAQAVLCPGWNDGEHLDRTMDDLWDLGPGVRTLSVVPVGLTRYNVDRPVRLLTPEESSRALEQVDRARARARKAGRGGWCYAADELFLRAGRAVPDARYYDDWDLAENGVGSVRRFLDRLPDVPLITVPGNHDVPLWRIHERLFRPRALYRRYIDDRLDHVRRLEGAVIVALDSTAPRRRISNGRIHVKQLDFAERAFEDPATEPDAFRVVVAHHHFAPAPDYERDQIMPKARRAIDRFIQLRVDLILGGHLHRAYIGNSLDVYAGQDPDHGIIIVQCGTTTSRRGRGREVEKNTFNLVRLAGGVIDVVHYMYFEATDGFAPVSRHIFPRPGRQFFDSPP